MLMLRYHDSNGIIAESPLWTKGLPLSSCKLSFARCSEQKFWPAKYVTLEEDGGSTEVLQV